MIWPYRMDTWHDSAVPARQAYANVANAIGEFEQVNLVIREEDRQYPHARAGARADDGAPAARRLRARPAQRARARSAGPEAGRRDVRLGVRGERARTVARGGAAGGGAAGLTRHGNG